MGASELPVTVDAIGVMTRGRLSYPYNIESACAAVHNIRRKTSYEGWSVIFTWDSTTCRFASQYNFIRSSDRSNAPATATAASRNCGGKLTYHTADHIIRSTDRNEFWSVHRNFPNCQPHIKRIPRDHTKSHEISSQHSTQHTADTYRTLKRPDLNTSYHNQTKSVHHRTHNTQHTITSTNHTSFHINR